MIQGVQTRTLNVLASLGARAIWTPPLEAAALIGDESAWRGRTWTVRPRWRPLPARGPRAKVAKLLPQRPPATPSSRLTLERGRELPWPAALVEAATAVRPADQRMPAAVLDEAYQDRIFLLSEAIRDNPKDPDRAERLARFLFNKADVPVIWNGQRGGSVAPAAAPRAESRGSSRKLARALRILIRRGPVPGRAPRQFHGDEGVDPLPAGEGRRRGATGRQGPGNCLPQNEDPGELRSSREGPAPAQRDAIGAALELGKIARQPQIRFAEGGPRPLLNGGAGNPDMSRKASSVGVKASQASALRAGHTETEREQRSDGVYEITRHYPPSAEQLAQALALEAQAAELRKQAGQVAAEARRVESEVIPALLKEGDAALAAGDVPRAAAKFERAHAYQPDPWPILFTAGGRARPSGGPARPAPFRLAGRADASHDRGGGLEGCLGRGGGRPGKRPRKPWTARRRPIPPTPARPLTGASSHGTAPTRPSPTASGRQPPWQRRRPSPKRGAESDQCEFLSGPAECVFGPSSRRRDVTLAVCQAVDEERHPWPPEATTSHAVVISRPSAPRRGRFGAADYGLKCRAGNPRRNSPTPPADANTVPEAPTFASLLAWSRMGKARAYLALKRPADAQGEFSRPYAALANWPIDRRRRGETMNVADSWARLGLAEAAVAAGDNDGAFQLLMAGEGWPGNLPEDLEKRRKAAETIRLWRRRQAGENACPWTPPMTPQQAAKVQAQQMRGWNDSGRRPRTALNAGLASLRQTQALTHRVPQLDQTIAGGMKGRVARFSRGREKRRPPYDAFFRSASGYLMREWYSDQPCTELSSTTCSSVSVRPLSSNWPSSSCHQTPTATTRLFAARQLHAEMSRSQGEPGGSP